MRTHNSFVLFISTILLACSADPKHPQAQFDELNVETEQSILAFADSIDAQNNTTEIQNSIIYQTAENSFYVDKLSFNGNSTVYREHAMNPGLSERTTSYYFKSDSLILVKDQIKRTKDPVPVFEEKHRYLRNGVAFKAENRLATSFSKLQKTPFKDIKNPEAVSYSTVISDLNDALSGSNKFDMVFDEIVTAPEGSFISLKSKLPGTFSSDIHLTDPDNFTDSLEQFPEIFKNIKLNINTKIVGNECIYVPVARKVTSASGLNR